MSSAINSVMQINERAGNMPMNAVAYRTDELRARREQHEELPFVETIVGRRGTLRGILAQVEAVAPTNTTVLIAGETGTGKEVIARAIHEFSPRRNRNLVKVNCAAIPPAFSKASSSVTSAERLRAPSTLMSAASRWRIGALCSSTKLETCH